MYRVKIKESVDEVELIKECGLNTTIVYTAHKKDNGLYEINGFEFEKEELEILD